MSCATGTLLAPAFTIQTQTLNKYLFFEIRLISLSILVLAIHYHKLRNHRELDNMASELTTGIQDSDSDGEDYLFCPQTRSNKITSPRGPTIFTRKGPIQRLFTSSFVDLTVTSKP